MSQLPKIVRDRLAGAPAAAVQTSHPDADLLTAFIEGGLGEREREQVLSHVATCAGCRDVVTLSTPELVAEPELQVAAAPGAPKKWWNMSALRWATVSATAVVVLAAALLIRPAPKQSLYGTRITSDASVPASVASTEARPPSPEAMAMQRLDQKSVPALSPQTGVAPTNKLRDKFEAKQVPPKPHFTAPREEVATIQENSSPAAGSNISMAKKRAPTTADREAARSSTVAGVAGASAAGVVGGAFRTSDHAQAATPASNMAAAQKEPPTKLAQNQPQSPVSQDAVSQVETQTAEIDIEPTQKRDLQKLDKQTAPASTPAMAQNLKQGAAPAPAVGYGSGTAATLPATGARSAVEVMATPTSIPKAKLPVYRWTIDASGNLQRSSDGKTWETISVGNGAKLQSLAVVEREVWTGGAAGLLFHSDDGGNRWTRVRPVMGDTVLADDITRINVPSAGHVTLTTSSGALWTSTDGGQTWHKQ